jgi:multiple sugar transport system ATP-binding protein
LRLLCPSSKYGGIQQKFKTSLGRIYRESPNGFQKRFCHNQKRFWRPLLVSGTGAFHMSQSDVRLRGIQKSYGKVHVIHGVDLDIEPGEFTVFVGPSGCGKTTLLRMIAGLEEISGGTLTIGGEAVNELPLSDRGVAMVFQSYALYPHKTVFDNMAFALKIAKVPKEEIEKRVHAAAAILQLEDYLQRLPKALSGGQRQRVAIGRAIVRNPKVFLFDEPLSNLDAALRTKMRVELATLHRSLGATMIYVTHDQVEAMTLADKIVVLNKGRVEQVGAPLDLYNKPASLFVAGFIGSPQMNFVGGDFAARHGAATVGLRPEHLRVQEGGAIQGTLKHSEKLGNETFAYVNAGALGDITARMDGTLALPPGGPIGLAFAPEHMYRFDAEGKSL